MKVLVGRMNDVKTIPPSEYRMIVAKAAAYDAISKRGIECINYCREYAEGRLGRITWHIVLDDAIKYQELLKQLKSITK